MKNISSFKIFEAFQSSKLSKTFNYMDEESKKRFLKYLDRISIITNVPISEFDDSLFQYLPVGKGDDLSDESNSPNVKWVKFWFDIYSTPRLKMVTVWYTRLKKEVDVYISSQNISEESVFWQAFNPNSYNPEEYIEDKKKDCQFLLVLDFQKLLEIGETKSNLKELKSKRIDYKKQEPVPHTSDTRLEMIKKNIQFEPTTGSIQMLVERLIGGKNMFYFLFSEYFDYDNVVNAGGYTLESSTTVFDEFILSIDNIFTPIYPNESNERYFEDIESIYESKKRTEFEQKKLNEFFKINGDDIEDLFWHSKYGLKRIILSNNYQTNIKIGECLAKMSNKNAPTKLFPHRKNMMYLIEKHLSEINKIFYEKFSPFNFEIYKYREGRKGLLNGWLEKIHDLRGKVLFPRVEEIGKRLSLLSILNIIIEDDYKNFVNYEGDWENHHPLDNLDSKDLTNIFDSIKKEISRYGAVPESPKISSTRKIK